MKIINKNEYKIMYGMNFLNSNEVTELDDEIAKSLIGLPGVEEFIAVEDAKKLENENEELKKKLAEAEAKAAKTKSNKKGK